jgi:hypothetical protein
MRRFRLSTLMLLIVIAALSLTLVVQQRQATRREAELRAQLARFLPVVLPPQKQKAMLNLIKRLNMQLSGK